jgi:hypothetical protein
MNWPGIETDLRGDKPTDELLDPWHGLLLKKDFVFSAKKGLVGQNALLVVEIK